MGRREFITLIGATVAAGPLAARAQQPAIPAIGFLSGASFEGMQGYVSVFKQSLADAGFVDGRNITIEYRWADGRNDRLPELAADLVRREVAVIVAERARRERWLPRRQRKQSQSFFISVPIRSRLGWSRALPVPAAMPQVLRSSMLS